MATIICQNYDISLGTKIPQSIIEVDMEKEFTEVIRKTEDVYKLEEVMHDHEIQ